MADDGDQTPEYDPPTTPFRKIVLPAEGTVRVSRPPTSGSASPVKPPTPAGQPAEPSGSTPAKPATGPSGSTPAKPAAPKPAKPGAKGRPASPAPAKGQASSEAPSKGEAPTKPAKDGKGQGPAKTGKPSRQGQAPYSGSAKPPKPEAKGPTPDAKGPTPDAKGRASDAKGQKPDAKGPDAKTSDTKRPDGKTPDTKAPDTKGQAPAGSPGEPSDETATLPSLQPPGTIQDQLSGKLTPTPPAKPGPTQGQQPGQAPAQQGQPGQAPWQQGQAGQAAGQPGQASATQGPGQPGQSAGQPGQAPAQPGQGAGRAGRPQGQPGQPGAQPGQGQGQPGPGQAQPGQGQGGLGAPTVRSALPAPPPAQVWPPQPGKVLNAGHMPSQAGRAPNNGPLLPGNGPVPPGNGPMQANNGPTQPNGGPMAPGSGPMQPNNGPVPPNGGPMQPGTGPMPVQGGVPTGPMHVQVGDGPQGGQAQAMGPLPAKPPRRGLGDIPMKAVYLLGAILATVLAVVLIFVLFSGDVPANQQSGEQVVQVAPVPTTATPSPAASATPTETPIVLPPVPASKAYARLPGKASVVTGVVTDRNSGISYPRLASPWKARSYSPYSYAQRIGKVEIPYTVIGSAMFPGESPEEKPDSNADYRELATQAARWTIRTQYPQGAKLDEWTASKKISLGKGWTLGYKVTYTLDGKEQQAQALVTVIEVGKTKPAMLLASIPETEKERWRDLNTLADRVRPL